ncbi:Ldh family oxidoreductase [Rhodovarius crocodyli]|nr:Ldh family oxidoreductase [Rhodovarius crocodyli]
MTAALAARHDAGVLRRFATELFSASGMDPDKAEIVAAVLVEADMLGHDTHGLALATRYLTEIDNGAMTLTGEPEVISDRGACLTWNGRRLPGPWLVVKAMEIAFARLEQHGIVSVAIGNGHHIGCLAAYAQRAAARGKVLTIHSCAPGVATVAPFGGLRAALSPAPFAIGFPTQADPVMIDISASITTNNMALRLSQEGRRYPNPWLMDAEGEPTDDPTVLQRGGTVLPAGGVDHGQKGYGWGLTAEALSQGLSGQGRADGPKGMVNAVFLQLIDPEAFAGLDAFTRQTSAIADKCHASPPRPGMGPVRLPGEGGLRRQEAAERGGVPLRDGILDALQPWVRRHGVAIPPALN